MTRIVAPYGSWPSPISASDLATSGVEVSEPRYDGDTLYWLEFRAPAARTRIVRRVRGGEAEAVTADAVDVRSRCHEYGGGGYAVRDGVVVASHDADRRLYRHVPGGGDGDGGGGGDVGQPITPVPPPGEEWRYADMHLAPAGSPRAGWLLAVRERHVPGGAEPVNELVWVPVSGGDVEIARSGRDFFASPRMSDDGARVTWLEWSHPDMPWDAAEAWVADVDARGQLSGARRVAGGDGESAFQPAFSSDGRLHVVSDSTGWWNVYAENAGQWVSLAPDEAEFGTPQWVFGLSTYTFLAVGRIAAVALREDREDLGVIESGSGRWLSLGLPFTNFGYGCRLVGNGEGRVAAVAGSPDAFAALVEIDVETGAVNVVAESQPAVTGVRWSVPQFVSVAGPAGTVHATWYPPASETHEAPPGERPPLIVIGHGGPTSRSCTELDLSVQFWTSRGFAVLHPNHSGSTGYGRAYRERLNGGWGVLDVADSVAAATYLAATGRVDPDRMVIRGGSAGGFTALAAVAFHDTFAAAVSRYGVADLERLAVHTHKFESRYLDRLVGAYPECRETYRERSPLHHVSGIRVPVLLLQGSDDEVVPPEQATLLADRLRTSGRAVAHVEFVGEGHGFRGAEAIVRALELELAFYGRVLGFAPADPLPPVEIDNFPV